MHSYSCGSTSGLGSKKIAHLSNILKLVSDESRLKLLCMLTKSEHCVCELMEQVSLSQSLISHHLSDLKEAGLVVYQKRGLRVYYSLTKKGKEICTVLSSITDKEEK